MWTRRPHIVCCEAESIYLTQGVLGRNTKTGFKVKDQGEMLRKPSHLHSKFHQVLVSSFPVFEVDTD